MEKATIEIIKEQFIGETSGHMASIPINPMLFSMINAYGRAKNIININESFELFIHDLSNSIDNNKNETETK